MTKNNNWTVKRLDDVATVTMGQSPASSSYNSQGAGVPFLQGMPPVVDSMGVAVPRQWTTEPTRVVEAGTALMTVRAPVGELFTTNDSVCLGRGLAGIKANNDVSQTYLNYYLQFSKNQLNTFSQGSTFTAINSGDLKGIQVVLPSYQKQEFFGNVLDVIDQDIAKTNQILKTTEVLKKGTMRELLTKGIGHKKFKKTKIGEIPVEWDIKQLNEITFNITDGKHGDCNSESDSGYYFVSVKDIYNGQINYQGARQITKSDFEETHKRTKLEAGDLLLTNSGTIGRMAVVQDNEYTKTTTFQKSVAVIKPDATRVNVYYLMHTLTLVLKNLITESSGSAQKNLLLKDLRSYKIPLPSLKEQTQICEVLGSIDSKLADERLNMKYLLSLKKGLMQDIFNQKVEVN